MHSVVAHENTEVWTVMETRHNISTETSKAAVAMETLTWQQRVKE